MTQQNRLPMTFGLGALLVFAGACGEVPQDLDQTETTQGALSSSFSAFTLEPSVEHHFAYGPQDTGVACYMTRLEGPTSGTDTWAALERETAGFWYLIGTSGATVTCVKLSWFQAPGSARMMMSPVGGNWGTVRVTGSSSNIVTGQKDLWWGDAVSYVAGLDGGLRHAYSNVSVHQGLTGSTPGRVSVAAASGTLIGTAASLFVGTPGAGIKAAFVGSPVSFIHTASTWKTVLMAKTSEAICFFTSIGGNLKGPNDVLKINTKMSGGNEVWALEAKAGSGGEIRVEARCMARNQPS